MGCCFVSSTGFAASVDFVSVDVGFASTDFAGSVGFCFVSSYFGEVFASS